MMRKLFIPSKVLLKSIFSTLCLVLATVYSNAEVTYALPLSGAELQIGNMLEWSTSLELNSERFVVQRSLDGISYEDIGRVEAAGLSNQEKSYHFMDIGIDDKKTFYRLKQVDDDGSTSYSQTALVHKKMDNKFMVMSMSSPETIKRFEVAIDFIEEGVIEYKLCTLNGDKIKEVEQSVSPGLNSLFFDLESEYEGIYKIHIKMGNEEELLIIRKVLDELKSKPNVASKNGQIGG